MVAVDRVWLFIPLLAVTIFLGAGAWPVCVDGALARVSPSERSLLAVSWNLREPGAMAISTLAGGYLLDVDGGRALLLALAGGLFAAAAMATLAVFRRPIRAPEVA
ncbi:MAG: hypothetical protein C4305_01410 [Thermoleophilia bacterium]